MATTASTNASVGDAVDRLAERYVLRDRAGVARFVRNHPEVVGPLLEAVDVVPRYFGPAAPPLLEVERDRDEDDDTELVALIRTDLDSDASLQALWRFDEAWGLDAVRRANLQLVFSLQSA